MQIGGEQRPHQRDTDLIAALVMVLAGVQRLVEVANDVDEHEHGLAPGFHGRIRIGQNLQQAVSLL